MGTGQLDAFRKKITTEVATSIEKASIKLTAQFGQSIKTSEFKALQEQNAGLTSDLQRIAAQTRINTWGVTSMSNSISLMSSSVTSVKGQLQALESNMSRQSSSTCNYCSLLRHLNELERKYQTLNDTTVKLNTWYNVETRSRSW